MRSRCVAGLSDGPSAVAQPENSGAVMQPTDESPPEAPKVPLIPLGVAVELVQVLVEVRNRCRDLECRGAGSGQSAAGVGRLNRDIATKLVLADLDHYIQQATDTGQQVSAKRWESVLEDLRNLKRKLDAET